jgi:PAS domain S-box-containing protein
MKNKQLPTNREVRVKDDDFIVSKTDTKGRITYCNRVFMHIAGYDEEELLGAQHNIVRHPDMPRAVFKLLWQTLESGKEFFGYVKNMTQSGDYYWVFANVTPSVNAQGRLIGYYSVRRAPKRSAVEYVIPIYAEMLALEQRAGPQGAIQASTGLLLEKLAGESYERFVLRL